MRLVTIYILTCRLKVSKCQESENNMVKAKFNSRL